MISPEEAHYLKHVVVNGEWPIGTTLSEYSNSLRETILNPNSSIFTSKFDGNWQIGFIGESGKWQGKEGYPNILVEYRVKYGYWVTGFQPENILNQVNSNNRSEIIWIRNLLSK